MKKAILTLALSFMTTQAFAEVTAQSVCKRMEMSTSSSSKCAQIISKGLFSQGALEFAYSVAFQSPSRAINVLELTVGQFVEDEAALVCSKMASSNSISCLKTILNQRIDENVSKIADKLLYNSSSRAIEILMAGAGAYVQPGAARICGELVNSPSSTIACVKAIANKVFYNEAETVCEKHLHYQNSKLISCLTNSGVPYTPVVQKDEQLKEIRKTLQRAKHSLQRGDNSSAELNVEEALRLLKGLSAELH